MQVAYRQPGALDVHREKHLRAAGQVLDIAVATVLAWRHGAGAFLGGLVAGFALELAHVRGRCHRRVGQRRHAGRVGIDQLLLAAVPFGEHHWVRQAANQAGVDQACELDTRNMPRTGVHPLEVPNGFLRQRKVIGQEAPTVLAREKPVEAPLRLRLGAEVEQVDHQQVTGLGTVDAHRAR